MVDLGPGGVGVFGVEGCVLIVLGVLAAMGKRLPIALACGLFVLDLALALATGGAVNPMALLVQIIILAHLARSWRRMRPRPRLPSLASVFE